MYFLAAHLFKDSTHAHVFGGDICLSFTSFAGPPISPFEQDKGSRSHSLQELDSDEEFGFEIPIKQQLNREEGNREGSEGELENGEVEVLEESGSDEELYPPPIPPRNHSLSPSPNMTPFHNFAGSGKTDIYADDHHRLIDTTTTSTSFLLEGRGGERMAPPLPIQNGIANGELDESPPPPPLPFKSNRRKPGPKLGGIAEEERMLMNELDLLEKLVDSKEVQRREEEEEGSKKEVGTEAEVRGSERPAAVISEQTSKA